MHFVDLVLCQLIVPFYNLTLIINVAMKKKTKKKRWSSIKFKSVYLTKSINLLQFPTNALKHEIKMFCVARKCKSYWHFMSSCGAISESSMWWKLCLRQNWEADCRKSEKPIVGNPTPLSLRLPRCHCLNWPSFTASIPFSCLPESQDSEFWDKLRSNIYFSALFCRLFV